MLTVVRRPIGILAGLCLTLALVPSALAGSPVDPSTLNPVPPGYYRCGADGANTICRGSFDASLVNADGGPLCGDQHLYETTTTTVLAVRFYDANRNLVRRTGRAEDRGFFSLSPTGAPPTIAVYAHWNWSIEYAVPGDLDSGLQTTHGLINHTGGSSSPGFAVQLHASGRVLPDGTFYGLNHDFGTPGANEAICAVLLG